MHVVFVHPDLGIGGAERSVIDAALALKADNHEVEILTAHHDPSHCFEETRDGRLDVTMVGDWLPRSIFGKFYAMCAYVRMIYVAAYLVFFSKLSPDIVFCDQISACIPVLKLSSAKILFYCHFPDMLLTQRKTFLKKLYRAPIDLLEEKTTGMADKVLVNSNFTAGVFHETFTSLRHIEPVVLYPIPDLTAFNKPVDMQSDVLPMNASTIFLSINRYERKKNLPLAVKALGYLKEQGQDLNNVHLIMAGGYDERVVENKEHYQELLQLTTELGLEQHVKFLRSISDGEKRTLLAHCDCLLYTPDREHFGIVPIEAMYMKCPVIAVNSGGPLETVDDGVTGFLCDQTEEAFGAAMMKIMADRKLAPSMGNAGRERVLKMFSAEAFRRQLTSIIDSMGPSGQ